MAPLPHLAGSAARDAKDRLRVRVCRRRNNCEMSAEHLLPKSGVSHSGGMAGGGFASVPPGFPPRITHFFRRRPSADLNDSSGSCDRSLDVCPAELSSTESKEAYLHAAKPQELSALVLLVCCLWKLSHDGGLLSK